MQSGQASGQPRARNARETLLVVEDDEALRRLIRLTFEKEGYRVLGARDGIQGLQLLEARFGDVDLVICDIIMPRLNGWQLRERALAAYPRLGFLLMTGFQQEIPDRQELYGTWFLEKPFHPAELVRLVQELLRNRRNRDSETGSGGGLASTA
jgi:DNA-binding response OmpR family regulator